MGQKHSRGKVEIQRFVSAWISAAGIACGIFILALNGVRAEGRSPVDAARVGEDTYRYTLAEDGSSVTVWTSKRRVLSLATLRSTGWQRAFYIPNYETVEIIDAHTEKADGRNIPVSADAIFDGVYSHKKIDISDLRMREIVFPDLYVGDTISFTIRKVSKPVVPGYFGDYIPALGGIAQTVIVSAPVNMPITAVASGAGYERRTVIDATTQTYTFTREATAQVPEVDEPGFVDTFERTPQVFLSAYKDYTELGKAIWSVYREKAQPTSEINALAHEITRGIQDRHSQAQAIDRWVKQNIRYMTIEIGAGGWIPDSAADVLAKRYGDCKNLSVLMMALLAASNIQAEFVLVNGAAFGDNYYSLPPVPLYHFFNHVFLHLPEFGHYADPSLKHASFEGLGPSVYDKPVLRFGASGVTIDRIPAMRADDHTVTHATKMRVSADGTISGQTTETTTGIHATKSRFYSEKLTADSVEKAAVDELWSSDTPGQGRFALPATAALRDPFFLAGEFTLKAKMGRSSSQEQTIPVGLTVRPRLSSLLGSRTPERTQPFVCYAGRQIEDIEIAFADGLLLPKVPDSTQVDTAWFNFRSEYRLEQRTLKIKRVFVSTVTSQVCAATVEAAIAEPMKKIEDDLGRKLTFDAATSKGVVTQAGIPK